MNEISFYVSSKTISKGLIAGLRDPPTLKKKGKQMNSFEIRKCPIILTAMKALGSITG